MPISDRERAEVLALRDRLQREIQPGLAMARRALADMPPEVWRAMDEAARWLASESNRLRRGLELARLTYTLLDPTVPEEMREEAAATLTRELPPGLCKPGARRAWQRYRRELAATLDCPVDEALRRLLALGIRTASERSDEPQHIRIGRHWITDARGRKRKAVPRELDLADLLAWLTATAYRHVIETAGWSPPGRDGIERLPDDAAAQMEVAARAGAGLTRLRVRLDETAQEAKRLLESRAALTAGQRRVLELAAKGHTTHEIAERLKLSPTTVRVHLRDARRRAHT